MQLTDTMEATDEDLARGARAGSDGCFEQLVRRYQVPLLRFLQRRAPNRQDAEDVVQEAFLRMYQSIDQYKEHQRFKPWLFTIAYRLAIDSARRRRPAGMLIDQINDAGNDSPMEQALKSDSKNHLWQLVRSTLNDEPFTAVWLHYGETMGTEEIAAVLGRSRDWVKTTLMRSRDKIKLVLEQS